MSDPAWSGEKYTDSRQSAQRKRVQVRCSTMLHKELISLDVPLKGEKKEHVFTGVGVKNVFSLCRLCLVVLDAAIVTHLPLASSTTDLPRCTSASAGLLTNARGGGGRVNKPDD